MKRAMVCALLAASGCGGATARDAEGTGGSGAIGGSAGSGGSVDPCPPCPSSAVCQAGQCVPVSTSGCALGVVAGGQLPTAQLDSSRFAGPGLTATKSGFVLAWMENVSGVERVSLLAVSDWGASTLEMIETDESCSAPELPTGLGASFSDEGMVAAPRPDCGDGEGAGAVFLMFDDKGAIGQWSTPHKAGFAAVATSAQPLAPGLPSHEHYFAYVGVAPTESTAQLAILQGANFKSGYAIEYSFDSAPAAFVNVASSESVLVQAGGIPALGATRLQLLDPMTEPPSLLGERELPLTDWVAVTAWDYRAALLSPSPQGPAIRMVEAATGDLVELLSGVVAAPPPTAGALTTLRDRLIVGTASGGSIRVQQSDALSLGAEATATLDPEGYDGELLAVAAARDRVAVAWIDQSVSAGTSPGGWALLECSE